MQYSAWAADGQGVDRHLFGLKKSVRADEGEAVPALFTDPAFARSSHWELSTSQLSSKWFDGWGYGEGVWFLGLLPRFLLYTDFIPPPPFLPPFFPSLPLVVPDGYGLAYAIGDDYIRWTITSLKRDTAVLKHYLAEAATEVKDMMERAAMIDKKRERERAERGEVVEGRAKL